MNLRNLSQLMVYSILMLPFYLGAAIYDGPTDDATFTALLEQVNEKSSDLDKKVEQAVIGKAENQSSTGGNLPLFFLVPLVWLCILRQSSSPSILGASND